MRWRFSSATKLYGLRLRAHLSTKASLLAARILEAQPSLNEKHYQALLKMAQPSTVEGARSLVEAYCASGQRERAIMMLQTYRPGVEAFEPLLVECVKRGDEEGFRAAIGSLRETGAAPSSTTFGALIRARIDCGQPRRAMGVCEYALSVQTLPPARDLDAMIAALCDAGLSGSALDLIAVLRTRHNWVLPRHGVGTNALLTSASQAYEMPLEALAVYTELELHDSECTTLNLTDELLRRCANAGNLKSVHALLRHLSGQELLVGRFALGCVLRAMLAADETRAALRIFDDQVASYMKRDGAPPWEALHWAAPSSSNRDVDAAVPCEPDRLAAARPMDFTELPEGVACIGVIRFFQRLALDAETLTTSELLALPMVLIVNESHRASILRAASSLSPPVHLQSTEHPGPDREAIARGLTLTMDGQSLTLWAEQVRSARQQTRRADQFAIAAVGHNALWALSLLGFAA